MKFKNKENTCAELVGGKKVWLSRSVAVCANISVVNSETREVSSLCVKRGENVSHSDKWCLPCGYLDYDETTLEAAVREVYEETGIYIPQEEFEFVEVADNPEQFLQNVTMHFEVVLWLSPKEIKEMESNFKVQIGESDEIKLMNKFIVDGSNFAFNHKKRILKTLSAIEAVEKTL